MIEGIPRMCLQKKDDDDREGNDYYHDDYMNCWYDHD